MPLSGERRSSNDRRRDRGGASRMVRVGLVLLLALGLAGIFGLDPRSLWRALGPQPAVPSVAAEEEERAGDLARQILGATADVWGSLFDAQVGSAYRVPEAVIFSGQTASPCGGAGGATGPFYCAADRKVYLDTQFFATLLERLEATGEFAAAYVISHEVAHHVQNELGILGKVEQARAVSGQTQANALTVRLELQADCLAGVWATHVDGLLEPGDLGVAIEAAREVGEAHAARRAGQVTQPHGFGHGTAGQRVAWFTRGYETGEMRACDTFSRETP